MVIKPFRFKTSGNQRKPWDAGGLKEVTSRFCTSWKVWAFSIDPCFFMVYYLWCFSILVTCSFSGFFQFKGDFLLRRPKQLKTLWLNSSELTDLQQFFFTAIATNLAIWLTYLSLSIRVHTTLLASMRHPMPFSACALKKIHFLWRWYCGKKQTEMWFSGVCSLSDNEFERQQSGQNLLWTRLLSDNILTTVMTHIVVDKSTCTSHAKPHSSFLILQ